MSQCGECGRTANVQLVLARHSEDVALAQNATEGTEVIVYRTTRGEPLSDSRSERRVANKGREALVYVTHLLELQRTARQCGLACVPRAVLFSQAAPSCTKDGVRIITSAGHSAPKARCRQKVLRLARAIAEGAPLLPSGFVDLDAGGTMFQALLHRVGSCWQSSTTEITGHTALIDVLGTHDWIYYSPAAQFAVARANILAAPTRWLERAAVQLQRSRTLPWTSLTRGGFEFDSAETALL